MRARTWRASSDALAADRDRERRAVDDGRRIEIAKLGAVDDIDGHAGLMGERGDLAVELFLAGCGEDQGGAGDIGGRGPGTPPLAARRDQIGAGFLAERLGEDDDLCIGLAEQPDLGRRLRPAADHDDAPTRNLVKGREDVQLAGGFGHRVTMCKSLPARLPAQHFEFFYVPVAPRGAPRLFDTGILRKS
jgi:hypothetical protein